MGCLFNPVHEGYDLQSQKEESMEKRKAALSRKGSRYSFPKTKGACGGER